MSWARQQFTKIVSMMERKFDLSRHQIVHRVFLVILFHIDWHLHGCQRYLDFTLEFHDPIIDQVDIKGINTKLTHLSEAKFLKWKINSHDTLFQQKHSEPFTNLIMSFLGHPGAQSLMPVFDNTVNYKFFVILWSRIRIIGQRGFSPRFYGEQM